MVSCRASPGWVAVGAIGRSFPYGVDAVEVGLADTRSRAGAEFRAAHGVHELRHRRRRCPAELEGAAAAGGGRCRGQWLTTLLTRVPI
jgi:hypothetical protein